MPVPAFFIISPDPFFDDVAEFIRVLSTMEPVAVERPDPNAPADGSFYGVSYLYGRVSDNPPLCHIFAHSGNQRLSRTLPAIKQFIAASEAIKIVGYIVLVDSKKSVFEKRAGDKGHRVYDERGRLIGWEWDSPTVHRERYVGVDALFAELQTLQDDIAKISPFVIAVLNQQCQDAMPLEEIRKKLPNPDIKLATCDISDKASVKNVFRELLKDLPEDETVTAAREAVLRA